LYECGHYDKKLNQNVKNFQLQNQFVVAREEKANISETPWKKEIGKAQFAETEAFSEMTRRDVIQD